MTDQPHFQNQGLAFLVLFARDKDRLAEFYRALGVTLESHRHPPCGEHYSSVGNGCVLEICQISADEAPRSPLTIGFQVSSVDEAVLQAISQGGTLRRAPHHTPFGRTASVGDP